MSQTTLTINVPEQLIINRVDELTAYKLRHEKLVSLITEAVTSHLAAEFPVIKSDLVCDLYTSLHDDLSKKRDQIIESFIESKRSTIYINDLEKIEITDPFAHKEISKLVSFLKIFKQAMIVGPTGSGKSTMAKQAAEVMNLPYASFSCNQEASKSELVGFANINGYVESNFLKFYENGGVFLVDEYDSMSPSISVVLNAAFDRSGQIAVPNRTDNPVAKKHPHFYCILAGNTWGSGSMDYQGREIQDMAFLDRFKLCRIEIDYDQNLEKQIAGEYFSWFMNIRNWMKSHVENENFSTRSIFDATALLKNGFSKSMIIDMISKHWEEALRKKMKDTLL